MTKPLCLRLEEAEECLNKTIEQISREQDLPCYLLVPIVSNLQSRLENGKRLELKEAKRIYEEEKNNG